MFPEDLVVNQSHNVVLICLVLLVEIFEKLQLYSSLVLESLFVSDDFDSHHLFCLVVETFKSLAKTT